MSGRTSGSVGRLLSPPIKFADINMDDYDAIAMAGDPDVTLDFCNSCELHQAILKAVKSDKIVAALCYSVGALVFCRDPENDYKSVIYGKRITAHPRTWDFYDPKMAMYYKLYGATEDNKGTDVVTPGFIIPLENLARALSLLLHSAIYSLRFSKAEDFKLK